MKKTPEELEAVVECMGNQIDDIANVYSKLSKRVKKSETFIEGMSDEIIELRSRLERPDQRDENFPITKADDFQSRIEEALKCAMSYGGIDGAHHKTWVIDQMVRALTGCVSMIRNEEHTQSIEVEESDEYQQWVAEHNNGEDGPDTYDWDVGIAP